MNHSFMVCCAVAAAFVVVGAQADVHQLGGDIEEVIITASPLAKSRKAVAGSVNLLSGEELTRSAAATLGETLKRQLGVQSAAFGSGVGVPVIRGFSGKRVEILQNGVKIADVSDTSPDHAVSAEPLLADKIEIIRGPAALRYGAGALGGVVNIIDNRIHSEAVDAIEGAAELRYDFNNHEHVKLARLDTGGDSFALHIDGLSRDSQDVEVPGLANPGDPDDSSRGFIENSDRRADSVGVGASWFAPNISFGVSANRLDNNYGIPPGAHEHGDESVLTRVDLVQNQYQARLSMSNLSPFWRQLTIDINSTDYRHQEIEQTQATTELGTVFELQNIASTTEIVHDDWRGWMGSLGLDYSNSEFSAVGEEAFVPASETQQSALYLIEERSLGAANVEFGARFDSQKISSVTRINSDSLNLSANLLMPIGAQQQLALLVAKVERAPVAQELFAEGEHVATGRYQTGDATLANEAANNIELSWRYHGETSAQVNVFYTDFSRYVYDANTGLRFSHDLEELGASGSAACSSSLSDFENDVEEFEHALPCYQTRQQGARFYGIEAEMSVSMADTKVLRIWVDAVRATLADGDSVPLIPAARLGVNWDYDRDDWSAGLGASHYFRQARVGQAESVAKAYTLIDAYIDYRFGELTVFAQAANIGDSTIRSATNVLRDYAPDAGRSFSLGLRYHFGGRN